MATDKKNRIVVTEKLFNQVKSLIGANIEPTTIRDLTKISESTYHRIRAQETWEDYVEWKKTAFDHKKDINFTPNPTWVVRDSLKHFNFVPLPMDTSRGPTEQVKKELALDRIADALEELVEWLKDEK